MAKRISYNELKKFSFKILLKSGIKNNIAKIVSEGLCQTSLRGVDSHGIRLLEHYSKSALQGRKNPNPNIKIRYPFTSVCSIDADHTYGHYAGILAVKEGIKISKKHGISMISVYNSTHCGSLAFSALYGANKGYIVLGFTHADSMMLAHNSKDSFFGTNPICFSAPRVNEEPFCLDMATTHISWNKLLKQRKENKNFQEKILADSLGNLTGDVFKANSLVPIGHYKGFGLATMIEILCGVYSGMNVAQNIPSMFTTSLNKKRKLSQFYLVLRTDGVISKKKFSKDLTKMSKRIRCLRPKAKKKVLVANDPEILKSKNRLKYGIPINSEITNQFKRLSNKFEIKVKYQ